MVMRSTRAELEMVSNRPTKNVRAMVKLSYAIVLEPETDRGFTVMIPALPEAHTQGETVEECMRNAREVIELVLEMRAERGESIPPSDDAVRFERVSVNAPAA